METLKMERAKSTPYLAGFPSEHKDSGKSSNLEGIDSFVAENVSRDDMLKESVPLTLNLRRKHKSCPSLPGAVQLAELGSPYPSPANNFSASNSEYEPDSPTSMASSTSLAADEKRRSFLIEDGVDFADSKIESEIVRHFKGQHRVHFASEVTEVASNPESALEAVKGKEGEEFDTALGPNDGVLHSEGMSDRQMHVKELKPNVEHQSRSKAIVLRHDFNHRNYEQNYQADAQRRYFSTDAYGDDEEEEEDEKSKGNDLGTANGYGNELQFEMDDIPSRHQSRRADNPYLRAGNNVDHSSSEEDRDEAGNLNSDTSGQKFSDNLPLYQRSPGSCSPRRSHEYIYLEKEDSVEVST